MNNTSGHDEPDRKRGAWFLMLGLCILACGYIAIGQTTDLQDVVTTQDSASESIDRVRATGGLTMVFGLFIGVIGLADLIAPTREEHDMAWKALSARRDKNSAR